MLLTDSGCDKNIDVNQSLLESINEFGLHPLDTEPTHGGNSLT